MASTLAPSPSHFCKMFTNAIPFHLAGPKMKLLHANRSHNISQQMHFHNCNGSRRRARTASAAAHGDGGDGDDSKSEQRAVEAVLKLYEAIKNKNVHQLSDVIAEECSCVSNFVSSFQPFLGKKVRRLHGYHLISNSNFQMFPFYLFDTVCSKFWVSSCV